MQAMALDIFFAKSGGSCSRSRLMWFIFNNWVFYQDTRIGQPRGRFLFLSQSDFHRRIAYGTNNSQPHGYVVAVISNQTDVAWSRVEFDARFFNKAGALIDVGRG